MLVEPGFLDEIPHLLSITSKVVSMWAGRVSSRYRSIDPRWCSPLILRFKGVRVGEPPPRGSVL